MSKDTERRDGWTIWLDRARWRERWWEEVLGAIDGSVEALATSRHARTAILCLPNGGGSLRAFAKVYQSPRAIDALKDLLRASKPFRALRAGLQLEADGFHVAPVLAAGEERRLRRLRRGFLLTVEVPLPTVLGFAGALAAKPARRRRLAAALGAEIGRLHRSGYVHGDLLATNLLVDEGPPPRFWFLDNDRTRKAPTVGAHRQRRRNLIQLNRLPLPGVTHHDRLRAFVAYAAVRGWQRSRWRREARWLARATRDRRRELEKIATRKAGRGSVAR